MWVEANSHLKHNSLTFTTPCLTPPSHSLPRPLSGSLPSTTCFCDLTLLKNANNHSYLIEEIRKRLSILDRANWIIGISLVKAQVGIYGNELADQLAKATTRNSDIALSFNRIQTSTLYSELKEEGIQNWQADLDKCTKAFITKEFFPNTRESVRLTSPHSTRYRHTKHMLPQPRWIDSTF
jgi:hypothetical protein